MEEQKDLKKKVKKQTEDKVHWDRILEPKIIFQLILGCSMAVIAMRGFMIPNKFLDGGITGISLLLHEAFHFNISFLVIVLNIPFIIWGYRRVSRTFAIQTSLAALILALGLYFIPVPALTSDKLLTAVFGGILIGTGIGLVIRSGGVLDGAEVVALFTKRKTGLSNSEIILIMNTFIFAGAAFHFGLAAAMYSLITYFTATRATDYIVDGIEQYTALNIITAHQDQVKSLLVNDFGKGITVYKGERGYLPGSFDIKTDCEIIVTIITRLEVLQLQHAILTIDPKAFIYVFNIKEAAGGILKLKSHAK